MKGDNFKKFHIQRGRKKGTILVFIKKSVFKSSDPHDFSSREELRIAGPEETEELVFMINKQIIKKGEKVSWTKKPLS